MARKGIAGSWPQTFLCDSDIYVWCNSWLCIDTLMNSLAYGLRPYYAENTGSHPNPEVKLHQARLVLGWGTTLEPRVLQAFYFCTSKLMSLASCLAFLACVRYFLPWFFVNFALSFCTCVSLNGSTTHKRFSKLCCGVLLSQLERSYSPSIYEPIQVTLFQSKLFNIFFDLN